MQIRPQIAFAAIIGCGLALAGPSFAQGHLQSVRVGQQVIMVGDGEGRLSRLGSPVRRVQTFNERGAPVGYRNEYRSGGRVVHVEVARGRVTAAYALVD